VRGLHYQTGQGKLVGVTRGSIWDVAVDIRPESPTRGRHFGLELNDENGLQLWIPSGFAHGFCVLGDQPADVLYLVDDFYDPKRETGIRWDDPTLGVPWPVDLSRAILSARDAGQPFWK
jgi:dTDP-4-dehydrorhamnose 3,5-epimerase